MKVLYIGYQALNLRDSGGGLGCIRNHDSLVSVCGVGNLDTIVLDGTSRPSLSQKIKNNLVRIIKKHPFPFDQLKDLDFSKFDIIYIDSSRLGNIAKELRKKSYKGKIITFYHNFDYKFVKDLYKNASWLKRWINVRVSLENEKNAVRYSDVNVILNIRDGNELNDFYGMKNQFRIPVSLADRYIDDSQYENPYIDKSKPNFLFVGSHFFGNLIGLEWFMKNVYPKVNMNFTIVGQGMDKLKDNTLYKGVNIYSNVPDVGPFLKYADCMLMPIICGSGMKVKTCEALMFGKNIIGTEEAFEGYDIDFDKVGGKCSTPDDFIHAINSFDKELFNNYSREIYLSKYSQEATLKLFNKLING
ncbi:glycosyltransferase [Prevotella sp.]|uniref:glycosyltransferase n=1 Tax=Prevotella sp. TaxID=59823 RepID=UPI0025E7B373|nr:glycosyltransferase [Prevotella sp.]